MANILAKYGANNISKSSNSLLKKYKPISNKTVSSITTEPNQQNTDYNNGGFLGGVGYTLGKLGAGGASFFEGSWDYLSISATSSYGALSAHAPQKARYTVNLPAVFPCPSASRTAPPAACR